MWNFSSEDISSGKKQGGERGFSLIELLVTITIMGVALVPMVNAYVHAWRAIMEAKKTSVAVMLARKHVETIIGTAKYDDISTGTTSGEFDPPYDDYSYEAEIERISGTDPDLEVKQFQIRIIYPTLFGGGERTVSCSSDADSCEEWDFATFTSKRDL